ncbi:hypothetical protein NM688_g6955 [Phlebia brevispora]|uniref:Uncharacterized protein n=1 Tax=Phlebia brevispora TaxID=194682 RepID=A0ACC1SAT1_9APHY|nr:hypothetical protein NM688_g6955 [Phlebia brevispora]
MSTTIPNPFRRRPTARSVASNSSDKQPPQAKSYKPVTLARRLLFPQLPPDGDLPPLLAAQSIHPELNPELYDFIAIALRAYVHPWWTKITRYDKEFLPVITRVLTSVIRTLETRLAQTDLSPLLLRDLPVLLTQHVVDYRHAKSKLHSSYAAGGAASFPQLFHQLQSHMALSPEGKVDDTYIRQAIDELLRACLPAEDYEAEAERYIVREIVLKVLVDGVIPRVTQPWFIHQSVLTLLGPEKGLPTPVSEQISERPALQRRSSHGLSLQSLAIFFFSTVQAISGACLALLHAYRHALGTIKKVNQTNPLFHKASPVKPTTSPSQTIPGGLVPTSPVPPPATPPTYTPPSPASSLRPKLSRTTSTISSIPSIHIPTGTPTTSTSPPSVDYVFPSLHLISVLLNSPPRTMSTAIMHILNLLLLPFSALISRLLPYLLYTHALSGDVLVTIIRSAKSALFPGGWPAVPPPDPTPEEQLELRKELTRRLLALIPSPLLSLLGSSAAARNQTMDEILEPLSSQECNTHLIVFTLDLLLVTIFPEMGVNEGGGAQVEALHTPSGSSKSIHSLLGDLTPPRPDSRPP